VAERENQRAAVKESRSRAGLNMIDCYRIYCLMGQICGEGNVEGEMDSAKHFSLRRVTKPEADFAAFTYSKESQKPEAQFYKYPPLEDS
jgi:hypothetical protein